MPLELALIAAFYFATNRWLGWWQPSEALTDPNILSSLVPALTPISISLQAGFMEECVFRAVPLALGALIGARYGAQARASRSPSCCRRWSSAARTRTIRAFRRIRGWSSSCCRR